MSLFRDRTAHHSNRVSFVELFFDLVFVFAITQLSHHLLHDYSLKGGLETGFLALAVWWAWIYTTWVTNWMNPESGPVRVMMFVIMGLSLIMATAIPKAFADGLQGLLFAGAYVALQLGRSLFMAVALKGHSPDNYLNFVRISCWLAFSAVFWIAGGLADGEMRIGLWLVAMVIDFVSPRAFFWVPGLGRSSFATWDVDGEHMAERCGLFIIIALGESVIVMGDTFSKQAFDLSNLAALLTAFATCVALWWLYFGITATKASHAIASATLPGRLAQLAYTYVHILLVAGVIVAAVGAERVVLHPLDVVHLDSALSIIGGPALFMLGNAAFIWLASGKPALIHLLGLAALLGLIAAVGVWHIELSYLGLALAGAGVLWLTGLTEPLLYLRRMQAVV